MARSTSAISSAIPVSTSTETASSTPVSHKAIRPTASGGSSRPQTKIAPSIAPIQAGLQRNRTLIAARLPRLCAPADSWDRAPRRSALAYQLVVPRISGADAAAVRVDEPPHRELRRNPDEPRRPQRAEHPVPQRCRHAVVEAGIREVVREVMPDVFRRERVGSGSRIVPEPAVNEVLEQGPGDRAD